MTIKQSENLIENLLEDNKENGKLILDIIKNKLTSILN